jgi:soluble lytic murein transglycosylase-like protein
VKLASVASVLMLAGCAPRTGHAPADSPATLEARRAIWAAIQPMAAARGLEPGFVYALVKAESNFDPHAHRGEGRGLMQIKPDSWKAVTSLPYDPAVWDARANLGAGIDALAALRQRLTDKGVSSYPMLWAGYRYGFDYIEARGFDPSRIPPPSDPVALELWSGAVQPVAPPQ